jgi:hypothetical protein
VIQLAVRAADASELPLGVGMTSNALATAVELGVELLLAADADFDADGDPQASASKNSDTIAAARFIGFTCCNGEEVFRLSSYGGSALAEQRQGRGGHHGSYDEEPDGEHRREPLGPWQWSRAVVVAKDQARSTVEQEQRSEDQPERNMTEEDDAQGEKPDQRHPVPHEPTYRPAGQHIREARDAG